MAKHGKPADKVERISQRAAAALLGITPRALRFRLCIPRNPDGSYSGPELLRWAVEQATGGNADGGDRDTLSHWRKEKLRAEAEREALALGRERGLLISREDHEAAIDRLCSAFSSVLGQIPALGPRVAGMTAAEATKELRAWADELRRETFKTDGNDT